MSPADAIRKAVIGTALLSLFLSDGELNAVEIRAVAEVVKLA